VSFDGRDCLAILKDSKLINAKEYFLFREKTLGSSLPKNASTNSWFFANVSTIQLLWASVDCEISQPDDRNIEHLDALGQDDNSGLISIILVKPAGDHHTINLEIALKLTCYPWYLIQQRLLLTSPSLGSTTQ
jgi:hypothetical protein